MELKLPRIADAPGRAPAAGFRAVFAAVLTAGFLAASAAGLFAQNVPTPPPPPPEIILKARFQESLENRVVASGEVEVRYGDIILYADRIEIDTRTKDVLATGHVSLIRPTETMTAETLAFNLDTALGKGENVLGLVQPSLRYESTSVERTAPDEFSLARSTFTTCNQPTPRWQFSASRANFVRNEYLEMWNAVLRIKTIPVFYLPYFKYPLDRERSTGFLMPAIGFSARKGFSVSEAFYWAIARNMDATFSLDHYSAKGLGAGLEYRYLFRGGTGGTLNAYYFLYKTPEDGSPRPENAYLFRWKHNQSLPGNVSFVADVDQQNSFGFMREFDNNYMRALVYNRSSQIYAQKSFKGGNVSARVSRFETSFPDMGRSIVRDSFPQLAFSLFKKKLFDPLYFSLNSTFHRWAYGWDYEYENGTERRSQEFYLSPALSVPFNAVPWINLNLALSGGLSYYWQSLDPVTNQSVNDPFLSGNYTFSAEAVGPVFYRIFDFASGTRIKHIIEPTFSYRFDSPTIDSERIVTTWGRYFRYHQIVYGFANHVLIREGTTPREIFTWGVAQAKYLLPEQSPLSYYRLEDGTIPSLSDVSTYVRFYPAAGASLDFSAQFNTYKRILSSVRASARLGSPADDLYLSVSWFKSQNPWYDDIYFNRHQISAFGGVKIPSLGLEALGEIEYNIADRKLLYTAAAAVYHYQCLDFKANIRVFFFREKPEVQFGLSVGLGTIGRTSDFLGGRDL